MIELITHVCTFPVSSFTREGNDRIRAKRLTGISLNIVLLWLGRHVVRDHYKNSEWFGAELVDEDYVFWFKLEKDKIKGEAFIQEVIDNGIPRMRI